MNATTSKSTLNLFDIKKNWRLSLNYFLSALKTFPHQSSNAFTNYSVVNQILQGFLYLFRIFCIIYIAKRFKVHELKSFLYLVPSHLRTIEKRDNFVLVMPN